MEIKMAKLKSKGNGDCIKIACEMIIENKEFLFCYAHVMGREKLKGQRILHAWNEIGDVVFDYSNGNKVTMRREKYYKLAQIKEKDVTKQTQEEVVELMLETKTYGGWIN